MDGLKKEFEEKFGELFGRWDEFDNFNLSPKVWEFITNNFTPKVNPVELPVSGQNRTYIKAPNSVVDWENNYVVATRNIGNSYGELPADTIWKITSSGITKHLESLPCKCCGMKLRVTTKEKKADFLHHFHFIEIKNSEVLSR